MTGITTAVGELLEMVGTILTTVTTNGILTFIFTGTCIVPIALRIYRKLRK